MIDKDAMRKDLFKTVDQYVQDVIPEGQRGKATRILKEIREGKIITPPIPEE